MAKGAYVGVDGVARKIKGGYVGVLTDVPIYTVSTVNVTASNISQYFTVENSGNASFVGSGSTFSTGDSAVSNYGYATTKLIAKNDIETLTFNYSYDMPNYSGAFSIYWYSADGSQSESIAWEYGTASKSYSGSLLKGERLEFSYSNMGGTSNTASFSNIVCKTTVQTGTESKGIARKIVKAYVGIGGVARPCWFEGKLAYWGQLSGYVTDDYGDLGGACTTFNNNAIFAGGFVFRNSQAATNNISWIDSSLTTHNPSYTPQLTTARGDLAAASTANNAIFAGGRSANSSSSSPLGTTDALTTSMTLHSSGLYGLRENVAELAGVSFAGRAVFAGGYTGSSSVSNYAITLDSSLTHVDLDNLQEGRGGLVGVATKTRTFFAGGISYSGGSYNGTSSTLDVYDATFTHIQNWLMNVYNGQNFGAASLDKYVMFAGGWSSSSGGDSSIDIIDGDSLTRIAVLTIPQGITNPCVGTTLGDYAIFTKKQNSNTSDDWGAFVVDKSLTVTRLASPPKSATEMITLGNYALMTHGIYNTTTLTNATIDAFTLT